MNHIVVVGNGIAGLTAAETLRSAGFTGKLTVVGQEVHSPYSRPALSKSAMSEIGEISAHLLPEPEHGAAELLGVAVTSADLNARTIELSSGQTMSYDGLVIASGIRPRKVREDLNLELTFRDLEDAVYLREQLALQPRVVVIGAGVLGMEIASSCVAAGCDVTIVSRRKPMLAFMGDYLADVFHAAAQHQGARFVSPGAADVRLAEHSNEKEIVLTDGSVVIADLVITAIGDVPNVEWLEGNDVFVDGELVVDSRGRVCDGVVAAGDVAAIPTVNGHERIPLWTSAIEQAKAAANALLHGDDAPELDFQQYFWTDQFGISLKACGDFPVVGLPGYIEGVPGAEPALLRWQNANGSGTAVSLNYRIPIPKLRALSRQAPESV